MKKFILFFFLLQSIICSAQNVLWTKHIPWQSGDVGVSIWETKDNHFIIGGAQNKNGIIFSGLKGTQVMIKIKSNGDTIWTRTLNGINYYGSFHHICEDNHGNYIGVGATFDDLFQTRIGFMICLDTSGTILWHKAYYYPLNGSFNRVLPQPDGTFMIVGDRVTSLQPFTVKMIALRTDSVGNVLWERLYGDRVHNASCFVALQDGSYLIAGYDKTANNQDWKALLMKITIDGDTIMTKRLTLPNAVAITEVAVHPTKDGGYMLTSMINAAIGTGIAKLDSNFNIIWTTEAFNLYARANASWLLEDGGLFLVGTTTTTGVMAARRLDSLGNTVWNTQVTDNGAGQIGLRNVFSSVLTNDGDAVFTGQRFSGGILNEDIYYTRVSNAGYRYNPINYICELSPPEAGVFITSNGSSFTFNNISYSGLLYNEYMRYHWDFGDGITDTVQNPTHTYNSTNVDTFVVTLVITNFYGCQDTLQVTNIATNPTIVNSLLLAHTTKPTFNFSIYPNPAKEEVNIILTTPSPRVNHPQPLLNEGGELNATNSSLNEGGELNATTPSPSLKKGGELNAQKNSPPVLGGVRGGIFNLQGKQLQTFTLQNEQITLSLRGLPSGMYIIQLQAEQGSVSKKLVKD